MTTSTRSTKVTVVMPTGFYVHATIENGSRCTGKMLRLLTQGFKTDLCIEVQIIQLKITSECQLLVRVVLITKY